MLGAVFVTLIGIAAVQGPFPLGIPLILLGPLLFLGGAGVLEIAIKGLRT